jgi:hypothetical protein
LYKKYPTLQDTNDSIQKNEPTAVDINTKEIHKIYYQHSFLSLEYEDGKKTNCKRKTRK